MRDRRNDQQGIATFTDVSPTRHLVVVKANGIETSKEITVTEDNLSKLTLTMASTMAGGNNTLLGIFYASLAVITVLIAIGVVLLRRKLNSSSQN